MISGYKYYEYRVGNSHSYYKMTPRVHLFLAIFTIIIQGVFLHDTIESYTNPSAGNAVDTEKMASWLKSLFSVMGGNNVSTDKNFTATSVVEEATTSFKVISTKILNLNRTNIPF